MEAERREVNGGVALRSPGTAAVCVEPASDLGMRETEIGDLELEK